MENNLSIISEKLNIDIAEAVITQAKLWENPNISINQVNLWSSDKQREGEETVIPPLFGSVGKNTEFNIELTQLLLTAGKRGKLVEREKFAKEISIQEFEEILRGLKIELRKIINEIIYQQAYLKVLETQKDYLSQLTEAYKKQVNEGNIPKSELLRLRSSQLEYENETYELLTELEENRKQLKILLGYDPLFQIEIVSEPVKYILPESLNLNGLFETAFEYRPENKFYKAQHEYSLRNLKYEKAMAIPDLELNVNYDRYGGVWKDFVGFGISMDLPLFNRNQGNIKIAKIQTQQTKILEKQFRLQLQQEIVSAYNNYETAYNLYKTITDDELLNELDGMLEIYGRNLLNRNISMLEYIDFMEAYKNNKQIILNAEKNLRLQIEELKYTIGKEL
ncbi:MAG: TolC family protein [Candidatus Azobacteroides sp.]|nr:TolC family protein [Candidatus Azobacteroides sp.]